MPASQPGKTISFTLLRNDVLALAVAKDRSGRAPDFPRLLEGSSQNSHRGRLGFSAALHI